MVADSVLTADNYYLASPAMRQPLECGGSTPL